MGQLVSSSLKNLLRAVYSPDEKTREQARDRIDQLGAAIVPFLIRTTRSNDPNLRWGAIDSLGSLRDFTSTSAVLERVLEDEDVHVRWRSIWAIMNLEHIYYRNMCYKQPSITVLLLFYKF